MIRFVSTFALVACLACSLSEASEIRAAWVTAWNAGFLNEAQADATVEAARRAGVKVLYIQVRKNADSYYESALEPAGEGYRSGFDPLRYVVAAAHAKDIEVHAWVNVFRVWTGKDPAAASAEHVLRQHPEWLNRDFRGSARAADGMFLDPGAPGVAEYIAEVVKDIVDRYDVDGIHLDYIRYPGREWGYSPPALARYAADTGVSGRPQPSDTRWGDWRRSQVTRTVRLVRDAVHSSKPGLLVSAATVCWGDYRDDPCKWESYQNVFQDWSGWVKSGLVDVVAPMNYRAEATSKGATEFRKWAAGFRKWITGTPIYVGIDVQKNTVASVKRQLEAARKHGLDGVSLFAFNSGAKRDSLVSSLSILGAEASGL